jgi:hypothetical protein
MINTQRLGGISALVAAGTFVFGIVLFATSLSDYTTGDPSTAESVAFVQDNQTVLYIWNLVIFIIFGIALVPLVIALDERLRENAPTAAHIARAFGIIWAGLVIAAGMIANLGLGTVDDLAGTDQAQAEAVWSALDAVQNGIGGGNEIVGALWVLLISWIAIRSHALPAGLNYLAIASGVAGLITIVPALEAAGAVFGIGLIIWFAWLGVVLLKEEEHVALGQPSVDDS